MDSNQTWIGTALIVLGGAGIFVAYSGVSRTFEEGLQTLSVLVLLIGAMFFAGGLFKGGPPNLKLSHAAVIGGVIALSLGGLTYAAIIGYGPFQLLAPPPPPVTESPIIVKVSIIPGSWDPNQKDNYVPKHIDVIIGVNNTVVWTNDEELDIAHTVTDDLNRFDSGLFGKGQQFKYTFTRQGEYSYHCVPHPWMRGSVTVVSVSEEELRAILEALGVATAGSPTS